MIRPVLLRRRPLRQGKANLIRLRRLLHGQAVMTAGCGAAIIGTAATAGAQHQGGKPGRQGLGYTCLFHDGLAGIWFFSR